MFRLAYRLSSGWALTLLGARRIIQLIGDRRADLPICGNPGAEVGFQM